MSSKLVLFVVLLAVVASVLVGCGGANVQENLKIAAKAGFETDLSTDGKYTRPQLAEMWAGEWSKIEVCAEKVTNEDGVMEIVVKADGQWAFKNASKRPECGMWRPWNLTIKSNQKAGLMKLFTEQGASLP